MACDMQDTAFMWDEMTMMCSKTTTVLDSIGDVAFTSTDSTLNKG